VATFSQSAEAVKQVNWRKIAITLIDPKAEALGADACPLSVAWCDRTGCQMLCRFATQ
jgi:hypothetical protein